MAGKQRDAENKERITELIKSNIEWEEAFRQQSEQQVVGSNEKMKNAKVKDEKLAELQDELQTLS